ncbi:hypothetical protein BD311DRAFT_791495 [Dichomitus squalens]|uniref:Uncharacterized protein n=1 Tax=Dichomitus squalens TaxID=114155 RepID=A0A4Q9MB33_9APHY|nr:hypothetical protein BD311DRAFT_791495 [Dichomitus squalens]
MSPRKTVSSETMSSRSRSRSATSAMLEVPDGDKKWLFLICRPIFVAKGLTGRGTRGFVSLEYDTARSCRPDRFVFLKDVWWIKYDDLRPEGDILAELNGAHVEHVPTLLCRGDIGEPVQETMTPKYWELENCTSSSLQFTAHTHQEAYRLDIIHHDISAGNLLLYPKVEDRDGRRVLRWVGLLTGWEFSEKIDEPRLGRQAERPAVELLDDLEAFFYVLLYYAVRYLTSNCLSAAAWIEGIFDGYRIVDDVYYVGEGKGSAIRTGKLTLPCSFAAHYKVLDYDKRQGNICIHPIPPLPPPPPMDHVTDEIILPKDNRNPQFRKASRHDNIPPTREERALAKNVADHRPFLDILQDALFSSAWDLEVDRLEDQISRKGMPSRQSGPSVDATGPERKKRRIGPGSRS